MTPRRKDNKNRVLKEGEYQRENGTYEFKWTDSSGKRRSRYAKTLDNFMAEFSTILSREIDATTLKADMAGE